MTIKSSSSDKTGVENLVYDPTKMSFEDFFKQNAVMFFPKVNTYMLTMGGVRMDLLPNAAKNILVRWIFEVNRRRLEGGLPLMVTYDIVKRCPLWQIIPMPYRNYKLTSKNLARIAQMVPHNQRLDFHAIK